jgi:hypothetical protein
MIQRINAGDFKKVPSLSDHAARSKEVARALDSKAKALPHSVVVESPKRTVTPLKISLSSGTSISAILRQPESTRACFVFAHGAGAGVNHEFMADLSSALEAEGTATLLFQALREFQWDRTLAG